MFKIENMKKLLILLNLFLLNACRSDAFVAPSAAQTLPEIQRLTALPNQPIRQIATDDKHLYLLDHQGKLWQTDWNASQASLLHHDFAPNTLISAENQHVAGIMQQPTWQWASWQKTAHIAQHAAKPAPDALAVWHSGCLIALNQGEQGVFPVRFCPQQAHMTATAQADQLSILPDNRPIIFENKVLFLGDPDDKSYAHGVLGDALEAKTLYTLDATTLQMAARPFRLPENEVFEHNTLAIWGDKIVAVVSGNGAGAKMVVLALQQQNWQIIAESSPLPNHRWQSPFVFAGELYAVQMPHLRGRLVQYNLQNNQLVEQELATGLSNHDFGSRHTQMATILPNYALIPQMGYRHIIALNRSGSLQTLSPQLPAPVVQSAVQGQRGFWLLADGSVWTWTQPET